MSLFYIELERNDNPESFTPFAAMSFFLHLLLILFFTVKTIFFPKEAIILDHAIKVDIVGLPDKLLPVKEESLAPPAKELPKKEDPIQIPLPKPNTVVIPDSTKSKQEEALRKLKAQTAIEKIQEQLKKESASKAYNDSKNQLKGAVITKGSELTGIDKLNHYQYLQIIEQHIRQFWTLPHWLAKKNLTAQVQVKFDEQGFLIENKLIKSSGNPEFDEKALEAVQNASPVPPLPEKFSQILKLEGMVIGFPE